MTYPGRVEVLWSCWMGRRGAQVCPCQPTQLEGFSWRFQGHPGAGPQVRWSNGPVIDALRRFRL